MNRQTPKNVLLFKRATQTSNKTINAYFSPTAPDWLKDLVTDALGQPGTPEEQQALLKSVQERIQAERMCEKAELDARLKGARAAVEVLSSILGMVGEGVIVGSEQRFGPDMGVTKAMQELRGTIGFLLADLERHIDTQEWDYRPNVRSFNFISPCTNFCDDEIDDNFDDDIPF